MESKTVFVDTSAFYALMDRADDNHQESAGIWTTLLGTDFYL